jgi:hypothetical protein
LDFALLPILDVNEEVDELMRIDCKSCEAGLDIPYQHVPRFVIVVCPLCGSRHFVSNQPAELGVRYLGSLYPVLSNHPEPESVRAWLSLKRLETHACTRLEPLFAAGE